MATEKGATYLDKLCHKLYEEPKGHGKKSDYVCRICGGTLETYYCEERLYLVKCADCGTLALVKTANPVDSARVTLARPTLTPSNEWVRVEDRLPDKPGHYLICTNVNYWHGGCMEKNEEHKYRESGTPIGYFGTTMSVLDCYYDITGDWNRVCNCHVTYWMPLPDPPDCRPPEEGCEIKDYAETCEECRFCDTTLASPPEGEDKHNG